MSKPNVAADRFTCDLPHERKLARERKVNARKVAKGITPRLTCEVCKRREAIFLQRWFVRIGQTFTPGYVTRRTCRECGPEPLVSERYAMPRLESMDAIATDAKHLADTMYAAILAARKRANG